MRQAIGIYSVLIGLSVMGLWLMILLTEEVAEGVTEMTFHLVSEFTMSIICVISGVRFLRRLSAQKLNIAGHSMVIYSALNAAGYYFQRDEPAMALMLIVFLILSAANVLYHLRNRI